MSRLGSCAVVVLVSLVIGLRADANELQQLQAILPDTQAVVLVACDDDVGPDQVLSLVDGSQWTVFLQTTSSDNARRIREAAQETGLLGQRLFVFQGELDSIPLSHNLADAALITATAAPKVARDELLRVLRPLAKAQLGSEQLVKPLPEGMDDWSHPFHAGDNNTQSNDQLVRGEFQTQFIGFPMFSPMPEQSVIAGGRIYKAMGNIAHKANQNEMLNTLLCINAYNGTVLWRRELSPGFMLHRNTMVATDDGLYMGDHQSCKMFDAVTGELTGEIKVDPEITDGPVWKWMALQGDTLFAMVGNPEVEIRTYRSDRPGIGHWPWGMWDGHDYNDPRTAFGHGRTLVAIDRQTGQIKWHYRDAEFLDARAVCMKGSRIYAYSPEKYLLCINAADGQLLWRNEDADLLAAIGPNEKAQHYVTGYATSNYIKCTDDYLFFAGPQRKQTVVASTKDGKLLWTNPVGNLQLVLRPEAIYAAGPENTRGMLLDYASGAEIASMPARRACTRATGCADSIFFRATGGTVRVMAATPDQGTSARHIAPMRPPCQDGVLVSNGHLYWGPWMCGCQLSLYGNIGLRPIGNETLTARDLVTAQRGLQTYSTEPVQALAVNTADWTTYQATNDRSSSTEAPIATKFAQSWSSQVAVSDLPTAPVAAGGMVFVADRSGAVRAFDRAGQPMWTSYTSGAIYYPPCIAHERLFVGSADGRVYAFEAVSGKLLWSYLVAPQDRRINIFGKLVSRWPVAGGVVADGDRVYAAAGLTHYDGTYVVALNAMSGLPEAINDGSGELSEQVHSGVSMQGELSIADGELRFAGGGVYELARYRLSDLECLNEPLHQLSSQYRTAFYAWYPEYNKYVSLDNALPDGRVLSFDANYDGSVFESLALEPPRPVGAYGKLQKDLAGEFLRRRGKEAPAHVWQDQLQRRFTGFAVGRQSLLAVGHIVVDAERNQPFIATIDINSGQTIWQSELPADAVKGGLAVDSAGQVFVSLENGQLVSFTAKED